ncbi:uncharacterized protein TNCV_4355111 [Trichonephila clavipes]|nr:uncharacterized protein TNCV_4355111 [Trichonephila clavipes]
MPVRERARPTLRSIRTTADAFLLAYVSLSCGAACGIGEIRTELSSGYPTNILWHVFGDVNKFDVNKVLAPRVMTIYEREYSIMPHDRRYLWTERRRSHEERSLTAGETLLGCVILIAILLFQSSKGQSEQSFPKEKCEALLPGCKCDDYEVVTGLYCTNVSDFGAFTRILEDGSLFEANTTYEITLLGNRVLPREFLKGLFVFRLYVDNPGTESLEEGAFDGVIRLRRLHVRLSSIKRASYVCDSGLLSPPQGLLAEAPMS